MPSSELIKILVMGDIVGKPGRRALAKRLSALVEKSGANFVIANGENASGGLGITPQVADELLALPIDVLTSGNHIWKHKDIRDYLDSHERLLRPANYPPQTPGRGAGVFDAPGGLKIGVLNLEGQLFMNPLPCPFREADRQLEELRRQTPIIIVDFHAEATSEKRSLGFYLDGRVTAVLGTHTHIPTADAEILAGGTGYLTDLGMTGPIDSVIGVRKEQAIARFVTRLPTSHQVARDNVQIQGVVITADTSSGKCTQITRHTWPVD